MNPIKIKKILAISAVSCLLAFAISSSASAAFEYKMLEGLPGFYQKDTTAPDLPDLIVSIYKFGIWTVGIAGLLMMTVGGVMYMGSAGNNAAAQSAKKIITDSLIGIVAALTAYLFMYVINPDLVNVNLGNLISVEVDTEGTPMGTIDSTTGKYKKITSGKCTVENLTALNKTSSPSTWATQASCICSGESSGVDNALSSVDKCQGGGTNDSVSVGLFQINLSVHKVAGLNCPSAFNTAYTAKIAKDKTKCWVTDRDLYNKCVTAASDPNTNINAAVKLYSQNNNWKQWGARKGCGL